MTPKDIDKLSRVLEKNTWHWDYNGYNGGLSWGEGKQF